MGLSKARSNRLNADKTRTQIALADISLTVIAGGDDLANSDFNLLATLIQG